MQVLIIFIRISANEEGQKLHLPEGSDEDASLNNFLNNDSLSKVL